MESHNPGLSREQIRFYAALLVMLEDRKRNHPDWDQPVIDWEAHGVKIPRE